MQNTDDTFSWDSNNQQTFCSAGETTLRGPAETFNKIQGCGLDVRGIALDGTQSGPLILIPDSTKSNEINWSEPSAVAQNSTFKFFEKADFRILGNRNLKDISLIDSSRNRPNHTIAFNLYDNSCVTLENLRSVFLGMSSLETATFPDFTGIQNSKFSIFSDFICLFYRAILSGYSTLDVQANEIITNSIDGGELEGLCFNNYSSLLLNARLEQHADSELKLSSSLSFHDSSHGNIFTRSIYNDVPDNNTGDFVAIDACDHSTVNIHTAQFLQSEGKGKIIQLSGNAKVTINPLNGIIPINLIDEMYHPTEKCWPGMINFKSGSRATLKLVGAALQNGNSIRALNKLKLVHIDGKPVDIASNFYVTFTDGITLMMK